MRTELQERCDLFIRNRDIVKTQFSLENSYIYPLCAAILTSKGVQADATMMNFCKNLLKQSTGIFSNFRGTSKMVTVTHLSLAENPQERMEQILTVYNDLKEMFWGSEYLAVAAGVIAEMAKPDQYARITQRTRIIYNRMKDAHPFLTSVDDSAFAALLALSELDDLYIEQEMERCYAYLKPSFLSGNAVQSLSHVLALGEGAAQQKCQKALDLFNSLKKRGYKYGTGYELPTLGALALSGTDVGVLAENIIEVDDFLKSRKGFKGFGIGSRQRLMHAGMLTMLDYTPDVRTVQTAALSGVVSLVIAQQVAIYA